MDRKSFVLYTASKEIIDELDNEQSGVLFKSILELVTDGEPLEMDLPTKIVFKTIREYLERDFESYQLKCEMNRINGSKGGRPKGSTKKPNETEKNRTVISKTEANPSETEKNIDYAYGHELEHELEEIEGGKAHVKKRSKKFEPPSVEEVRQYIESEGYSIDAQQFVDYYEARGWELSKGRKVKDWKACVRTWNNNSKSWNKEKQINKGVTISDEQRSEYSSFGEFFE